MQTIDTTGTYQNARRALLDHHVIEKDTVGLNWENVSKRIIPQIIYKGQVLQRTFAPFPRTVEFAASFATVASIPITTLFSPYVPSDFAPLPTTILPLLELAPSPIAIEYRAPFEFFPIEIPELELAFSPIETAPCPSVVVLVPIAIPLLVKAFALVPTAMELLADETDPLPKAKELSPDEEAVVPIAVAFFPSAVVLYPIA